MCVLYCWLLSSHLFFVHVVLLLSVGFAWPLVVAGNSDNRFIVERIRQWVDKDGTQAWRTNIVNTQQQRTASCGAHSFWNLVARGFGRELPSHGSGSAALSHSLRVALLETVVHKCLMWPVLVAAASCE